MIIMPRIIRNTLLNYTPDKFEIENKVKRERIFEFNKGSVQKGSVIYLIEREIRLRDNFALQFALEQSKKYHLPLKIIHGKINREVKNKQDFILRQIENTQKNFKDNGLDFVIFSGDKQELFEYLKNKTAILIIDFDPIKNRKYLKSAPFKIYEIDGHNIIPARFLSDKQEYGASTIRRKIYLNIYLFLNEYKNIFSAKTEAEFALRDFIENKLDFYAQYKNDPTKNATSTLSKYLNLGFISSQRVALEVIKSNTKRENKEAYLEELITRKELADNFCLYCKNFKSLNCASKWAKETLEKHKYDLRQYVYSKEEFENSKTHDPLWNAAQIQLREEGTIDGYLRMYWAKQILKWSISPNEALKIAIYLNDKYAYDAPSANGYLGILWSIFGISDRAFIEKDVIGKIRDMTYNGAKAKFNIEEYIKKFTYKF